MECQSRILPGQQGAVCEKSQKNKSLAFLENGKMPFEDLVCDQVSHEAGETACMRVLPCPGWNM